MQGLRKCILPETKPIVYMESETTTFRFSKKDTMQDDSIYMRIKSSLLNRSQSNM